MVEVTEAPEAGPMVEVLRAETGVTLLFHKKPIQALVDDEAALCQLLRNLARWAVEQP